MHPLEPSARDTRRPTRPAAAEAPRPVARTAGRARVAAAGLAIAAAVAAVNLLVRPLAADATADRAAVLAVREAVWLFGAVGGIATGAVFVALGLVVCLVVPAGRGYASATSGAALTVLGGISFAAGFFAFGVSSWFATLPLDDPAASVALFDAVQADAMRSFGPQLAGFLLASVGTVLLAVALWRSRTVPRWLPATTVLALVAMFLVGGGLLYDLLHAAFMATLVVLAVYCWRSGPRLTPSSGRTDP
ncbi:MULTISPECIES: hypothetical protein [Pseudonocardia]|uniref:DUF4386 domain-containing protein n=2 Tax=Pseudonocardia TaxID=1847 RepID=A0A1Y2NA39_PSEAH|nr:MULTISPECIES: hypothetical protein [Pseudonocardia]OSY44029.1 hypothetical protein BG845_00149 [Pseudonocardia autotrophica]TDN74239.1 hypothetical protein C8E95_3357 [Pseudonocardia autotrophica]BBG05002.1 hypothetical protein Pdca_62110 [Pseudonocardia autotrophica]GEC28336.1 hypothetical protein PSA01_53650 [Pseudonocardia saturnea]